MADTITATDVEATYSAKSSVEKSPELKQNINLGFANTTGNTEILNFNTKYNLAYTYNDTLNIAFDSSFFITKNNKIKDNEEYTSNLGLEQLMHDGWLGYASINWLKNEFLNYDNKMSIGIGIGKELLQSEKNSLKIKVGIAQNIEEYSNNQAQKKYTSLNEYIEYKYNLNEISKVFIKVGALENFDDIQEDYEVLGALGANFSVAENISLTIEEEIHYDNLPPLGFEKTDTKSIVRLGYNF
jgi:putative salt-induced outer membrane protein